MDITFEKNKDEISLQLSKLTRIKEKISLGGGQKKIDKQHAKGKLTARERINYLLDDNTPQLEIGNLAGYEMYEEHGGCPAGGVVVVIGYVYRSC